MRAVRRAAHAAGAVVVCFGAEGRALAQGAAFAAIPGVREPSGRVIVKLKDERALRDERRDPGVRVQMLDLLEAARAESLGLEGVFVVEGAGALHFEAAAGAFMATGAIEYIEPDWRVFPAVEPDDPGLTSQWQHDALGTREAWSVSTGLPVIVCAACDSGVQPDHPDLAGALVPGADAVGSGPPVPQAAGGDVSPANGHGTFVAGCMGAIGDNGVGVSGVGWNLSVMPVRVTDSADGTALMSDIAEGAVWAARNGARVVNCSYTGVDTSTAQATGATVRAEGGLLFWSAGNDGRWLSGFDHADVIVVGATTPDGERASWSAYGPAVDVFAPGSGVWSTRLGSGYGPDSGTSYSSPIAAGVAALVWSAEPALTPGEVEQMLFAGCEDAGAPGEDDEWGHGRVSAAGSVALVPVASSPPGSFETLAPPHGASDVGTAPVFEWHAADGASWYEVVVDDDPAFGSPEISAVAFGTRHEPAFLSLAYDTAYHARVTAHNVAGEIGSAGGVVTFSTGPASAPGPFSILSPADGSTGVPLVTGVSWTASSTAERYRVTLDDDADLASPIVEHVVGWDQPWVGLGVTLEHQSTYHWSVVAENDAGATAASPGTATFTTVGLPPPRSFSLLSPGAGATDVAEIPAFEWGRSTGAQRYVLEVATDALFGAMVYSVAVEAGPDGGPADESIWQRWKLSHLVPAGTLDRGVTYHWRVTAENGGGLRPGFPGAMSFTTISGAACVGDVNGDGVTDIFDFGVLVTNLGRWNVGHEGGDLTGDGYVDVADFGVLVGDFGCGE
jgi:subtilisin family serine protease